MIEWKLKNLETNDVMFFDKLENAINPYKSLKHLLDSGIEELSLMSHLNAERLDEYAFVKNYKLDIVFDETGRKVGQKWINEFNKLIGGNNVN
jgi:hypothetical protein